MRLVPITFDGYASGQTDFGTVYQAQTPEIETAREQLLGVVERIADSIIQADENRAATSIIVVGHSDRQDLSSMNCDQRRSSEIAAARDRAVSAWEFVKQAVTERLAAANPPIEAGDWWETAPAVTWGLVYAAAGMLRHDPPADETQRRQYRRVVMLVTMITFD